MTLRQGQRHPLVEIDPRSSNVLDHPPHPGELTTGRVGRDVSQFQSGASMPTPMIHGPHFKQLELEGRASISTGLTDEQASGINAYELTDGMWYVGKSKNVKAQHVQHMTSAATNSRPVSRRECRGQRYAATRGSSTTPKLKPLPGSSRRDIRFSTS